MDRLYAALPDNVAVVDVAVDGGDPTSTMHGDSTSRANGAPDQEAELRSNDASGAGETEPRPDWNVTVRRTTAPISDAAVQCVAASPLDPDVVVCGTADHGLFRSVDAGATWTRVDGIDQDRVTSVTCAVVNGDDADSRVEWWAGTEPSRVYRSTDGETWTEREGLTSLPSSSSWAFPPRPHTHHVRWIEIDPHDPGHLYVAVEAGALATSRDAGGTWQDRVPDSRRDTHSMATHPDAPGRAYCAAGDGYAETTDGGETWHHPQAGLEHRYCWSVAVDPADPDVRLLSAARGAMTAHRVSNADSYVYRRRTDDEEWHRLEGLPTGVGVTRYVLEAAAPGRFFALSNRGLFATGDGGDTWDQLPVDVPEDATAQGLVVVEAERGRR